MLAGYVLAGKGVTFQRCGVVFEQKLVMSDQILCYLDFLDSV